MKIALLGYGKMGKAIEEYCHKNTDHEIVLKIDENNAHDLTVENLQTADVAIDFSLPEIATKHIRKCFESNLPVVCGTTGWLTEFEQITEECKEQNQTFFYSSNYSVGVHLFWKIVSFAGKLINHHPTYSAQIEETHHIHKKDAPSGTAITTAEILLTVLDKYENWHLGNQQNESEIPIFAHRKNEVPGTHIVTFEDSVNQITIEHLAKSRMGFVSGAVKAAEFIQNKKGVFGMDDLLAD